MVPGVPKSNISCNAIRNYLIDEIRKVVKVPGIHRDLIVNLNYYGKSKDNMYIMFRIESSDCELDKYDLPHIVRRIKGITIVPSSRAIIFFVHVYEFICVMLNRTDDDTLIVHQLMNKDEPDYIVQMMPRYIFEKYIQKIKHTE
jgi:hypothetical protein